MTKREIRTFPAVQPFTVRTLANGQKQVKGYAVVWNSPSTDLGGFTEVCSPGMLTRTLRENPDVLALRDHKQEMLLGRTTAGTLKLNSDSHGLAFAITLPQTAIGDDTAENVRLRNLTGCSFGFIAVDDSWDVDAAGNIVRTLLDVDLLEISITSFPAYTATTVNTRSCPTALRSRLRLRDEDDPCDCPCPACTIGACNRCTRSDCDDTCLGMHEEPSKFRSKPARRDDDADDADDEADDCDPTIDADCDLYDADDDDEVDSTGVSCECPVTDEQRADTLRIRQLFHQKRLNAAPR